MTLQEIKQSNIDYLERKRVAAVLLRAGTFCDAYHSVKRIFSDLTKDGYATHGSGFMEVSFPARDLFAAAKLKTFIESHGCLLHVSAPISIHGTNSYSHRVFMRIHLDRAAS